MVVAIDVTDEEVRVWSHTDDGDARYEADRDYHPTCYVAASETALDDLRARLADDPKIVDADFDRVYTSLRDDERQRVLAVTLERQSEIATFAREVRTVHEPGDATGGSVSERASGSEATRSPDGWAPGTFRLYDVDLSPKFRYCLDTGLEPMPADPTDVRTLRLTLETPQLAAGDVSELTHGGKGGATDDKQLAGGEQFSLEGDEATVLQRLRSRLDAVDPDVLVLSSADLVPLLHERAAALDVDLQLGRLPGHTCLAGENSYESYGRVGHSPARYDVPGRAIVDRSNSFFWHVGGLPGLYDLVERSWKPLQEAAWSSIGTIFTAMQIRQARDRGVVVPWRSWEAESFTSARTLHDADRGGLTFEPEVGFHEDVVEVDFASLYPNIMVENRLSPETVRCDCHAGDGVDPVPGLGYSVCPDVDDPFVPSVLRKLVEDRAEMKRERAATDDPARRTRLDAKISGLKWILVTCFGYQGYRNSKFGRIEVHESINAYAREYLLDAKVALEDAGWRVVHGIVDSLWVAPREGADQVPIDDVCETVSEDVGIDLEHESDFEWVAFVPRRDGRAGSLMSYFGKRANPAEAGEDEYKFRGIEARQRSTPAFVGQVQVDLVERLDATRDPTAVCERLARAIGRLRSGDIEPSELVIRTAASKGLEDYDQRTRTVAALERYRDHDIARHPGQDVRYVVVDDDRRDRDRVRLPWESTGRYDEAFYETLLIRAAESVLSPVGWDRERIREWLSDGRDLRLSAFE